MTDKTPLIPEKGNTACADVRRALHLVLRAVSPLPPEATPIPCGANASISCSLASPKSSHGKSPSRSERRTRERRARGDDIPWRGTGLCGCSQEFGEDCDCALLRRADLMPTVEQGPTGDAVAWLQREQASTTELHVTGGRVKPQLYLPPPPDNCSLQSLSIGQLVERDRTLISSTISGSQLSDCMVCCPKHIHFVNFTVGEQYLATVRLVNVSRGSKRLSVSIPQLKELSILLGPRGLTVTAGAAIDLHIRFTPLHPRSLRDELCIRVEDGRTVRVPVLCYMQPPMLHVVVLGPNGPLPLPKPSPRANAAVLDLGAALLGETHRANVVFRCLEAHAEFCALSEEYWLQGRAMVSEACRAGSFSLWPARWTGGGQAAGGAACRARNPGLHTAALRVLSATGVTRSLQIIADSLCHQADHVTLHAAPRDYDICGVADAGCDHFLHLGTAPPGKQLRGTVKLVNHSPLIYKYSWRERPWGSCICSPDEEGKPCPGGEATPDTVDLETMAMLHVTELQGELAPRSERLVHVWVDTDDRPGTHRAVLMLTLHNIPKESFPPEDDPNICSENSIYEEPVPGFEDVKRVICSVIHTQLELWWRVQLPQISLMPIHLDLVHSRRVFSQLVKVQGWLLSSTPFKATWSVPPDLVHPMPPLLNPENATIANLLLPTPKDCPTTHVVTLSTVATAGKHPCPSSSASMHVVCTSEPRALRLSPARVWLGVCYPGQVVETDLVLHNDTHEQVYWCAMRYRWLGGADLPCRNSCVDCKTRACTCDVLRPSRGRLGIGGQCGLHFKLMLPKEDGACIWLASAGRTQGDVSRWTGAPGSQNRATVIAARVLAPRVLIIPVETESTKLVHGETCEEQRREAWREAGVAGALLRLRLFRGERAARTLLLVNTTPLATTVQWEPPLVANEPIQITFKPNSVDIGGNTRLTIEVRIEALAVSVRRVLLRRALVLHGKPMLLLFDIAVEGVRVCLELPAGDERVPIRRSEREKEETCHCHYGCCCHDCDEPEKPAAVFTMEDKLRIKNKSWICNCRKVWKTLPQEIGSIYEEIEIVTSPPAKVKVCPCAACGRPVFSHPPDPPAIIFTRVPVHTESSRLMWLYNPGSIPAMWRTCLRTHARPPDNLRKRLLGDFGDSRSESGPGLQIWCDPAKGTLLPGVRIPLNVTLLARRPGLYRDQLLVQVSRVNPIVFDVWVEIVGTPIRLITLPTSSGDDQSYTLWLSATDPERTLRAKNVSGATLNIQAYIVREHDSPEDKLPFRLMYRFIEVQPLTCPCTEKKDDSVNSVSSISQSSIERSESTESVSTEMATSMEVFLTPDAGYEDDKHFQVDPFTTVVPPGGVGAWCVKSIRQSEPPPPAKLLLRIQLEESESHGWWQPTVGAYVVDLRVTSRTPRLQAPRCVRMRLCALDLPCDDVMRVRKPIIVSNSGNGAMTVTMRTEAPWSLLQYGDVTPQYVTQEATSARQRHECGNGCRCHGEPSRFEEMTVVLPATSSMRVFVEVQVSEADCPCPPLRSIPSIVPLDDGEIYSPALPQPRKPPVETAKQDALFVIRGVLEFVQDEEILQTTTLSLSLFVPLVTVEPTIIDFEFVTDGDTRKSYYSVGHTSATETINVKASWSGSGDFKISPRFLRLSPGARAHVYILYTAKWTDCNGPVEGTLTLTARGGAHRPVMATARGTAALDNKCHQPVHDYTDSATPAVYDH